VFAVWTGGLGIWGGVALAAVVGAWRVRRRGADVARFMDAVAPALLVVQGVGRIGNYFNKELYGGPTGLPWALQIPSHYRYPGYARYGTFQPSFLYELIFDLALAAALVWLGHHRNIRPPGLFALYVTGYSAYRMFEESLRIDPSQHFAGLRLDFYIAAALTVAGRSGSSAPSAPAGARSAAPSRSSSSASSPVPRPAAGTGRRAATPQRTAMRRRTARPRRAATCRPANVRPAPPAGRRPSAPARPWR
jgi:hypothetical protein